MTRTNKVTLAQRGQGESNPPTSATITRTLGDVTPEACLPTYQAV